MPCFLHQENFSVKQIGATVNSVLGDKVDFCHPGTSSSFFCYSLNSTALGYISRYGIIGSAVEWSTF